jgi:putative colanic acid biosynthesis UDP-glucose lipid carrier transferase
MISDRTKGIQNLVLLCQCVLVSAAFWLWLLLCSDVPLNRGVVNQQLIDNLFLLLGLVVGSRTLRTEFGLRVPGLEEASRRSFKQVGASLFYLLLFLVAAREGQTSRLFFFSFIPLLFIVLFASNRYLPHALGRLTFRENMTQRVLLVGPRAKAVELKRWLDQNQHLGFEVQGVLTDDAPHGDGDAMPTLGKPEDLGKVLIQPGITKVIMAEFPRRNGSMRRFTDLCESRGSRLLVVADMDKIFGHPVAVFENQGMWFLGIREEPLEDPINRFFKRCLDIAVSLPVVLVVLPPLMFIVWIAQKLQSPGPLFFWQPREGFLNEPFNILKFRTMHVGAVPDETLPSSREDPRLYPFGGFLRKTSLDEIPQFWNVLNGKMSVVGPRPHLKAYNDEYRRVYFKEYVRSLVKPGITGLAQARGFRGDARTPDQVVHRMESDIQYLENWSFWLDCWLILRTAVQIVVPPKGAV